MKRGIENQAKTQSGLIQVFYLPQVTKVRLNGWDSQRGGAPKLNDLGRTGSWSLLLLREERNMKVRVEFSGTRNDPGMYYDERCEVFLDGTTIAFGANFGECPEDANLGRDLGFIYGLPDALRRAHEAGSKGEPFELEEIENCDD